jgi:iron complex transport system permease protein
LTDELSYGNTHRVSKTSIRSAPILFALGILFLGAFIVSCALGRYPLSPFTVLKLLVSRILEIPVSWPPQAETVLFQVRLPRVLAASLVGAALSAAGAAYQGLFRNPLVSPDVLGVSAGAGFGAALAILFSLGAMGTMTASFSFGVLAAVGVGILAAGFRGDALLSLVLSGIVAGSLFSSATSFLKLVADPSNILPAITYWLMGSLASIRVRDLVYAGPLIAVALAVLYGVRWRLNVLTMGEDEARTLGTDVPKARAVVIVAATMATAVSVAISGMIGWVGLVVPHLARMLAGSDYRALMPASMLLGATFLLVVDDIARLATTTELPLGILTAFVGAPFFIYLARRRSRAV